MKYILTLIFVTLFSISLQAQETVYTVDNLPKTHLQDKTQYVCNPAQILSQASCDTINNLLYALEQQTGIETVVAVVPSIGTKDCFDFCHQLLNQWGVGKKEKDNGLVILLVTDQRCIQFYTGYGLEGVLPDAICKRIQTRYMIPYLKDGNWDEGMVAGIKATCQVLDGSMENDAVSGNGDRGLSYIMLGAILLLLFGGGIAYMSARRKTRCPKCGKHTLQRTGSQIVSRANGVKVEDVTYTCRNCGYTTVRRQKSYDNDYNNRGGGGPFIGGFGGGRSGGGGFGGGSFGGGSGGTHEKSTLEGVIEARSKATQITVSADDLTPEKLAEFQKAQGQVTSALSKLLAITESYPDLKANENFLELQAQLEGTENRINVARKNFNDAAQVYNTNIRKFPKNIFAGMFGFEKKPYYQSEEGSEVAPKVEF